jgi:predicted ATPase
VLQVRRRGLHARILRTIEALYPGRLNEHVERLAQHAFRGEVWGEAVAYCRQAGAKASAHSAYREAIASFEQALGALRQLPETKATQEIEVDV